MGNACSGGHQTPPPAKRNKPRQGASRQHDSHENSTTSIGKSSQGNTSGGAGFSSMGPTAVPHHERDEEELSSVSSYHSDGEGRDDLPGMRSERSKSITRIDKITLERDAAVPNIADELFVWDDFTVDVNEAVKSKNEKLRHFRHPGAKPKDPKKDGSKEEFTFNDFTHVVDEVEDLARSVDDLGKPPTTGDVKGSDRPLTPTTTHKIIMGYTVETLVGHSSRVKCISVAPGEKEYVSCSNEDASVTMFNLKTGREMASFMGHEDTVINACFSADCKYLATTSRDNTMILWDVVTAKQILTFEHAKVVICCCFSRDGRFIATGCQDKVCRLWETRKGREFLIFAQHEGIIISMSYAPDNQYIVSASADRTLRVWSTTTGKCRHVLTGHKGIVLSCQYSSDGKRIVSNDEKLVRVWNAEDGSCTLSLDVNSLKKPQRTNINRRLTWTLSCYCPGQFTHYIVAACNNRFVYILDAETGDEALSYFCKAPVYCLNGGYANVIALGDSFGNVYTITLR